MSADLLREAAKDIRARAQAAVLATGDEPWQFTGMGWDALTDGATYNVGNSIGVHVCQASTEEQAEHILAWHPAVALAVADWLEGIADEDWCCDECKYAAENENPGPLGAVAVARAYLGRDA